MTRTDTVSAWVWLDHPDEVVEGHFYTPEADEMIARPSTSPVACPFCSSTLMTVVAPYLGRIMVERPGTRDASKTMAVIDLVPSTHEALSCPTCDMVLTRVKDAA